MAAEDGVLRRIEWFEVFPYLRLFRTAGRALSLQPLLFSFISVFLIYLAGRLLDALWLSAGAGVLVDPTLLNGRQRTEIETFAAQSSGDWQSWRQGAITARATQLARDNDDFRKDIKALRSELTAGFEAGLVAIDSDTTRNATEKATARAALEHDYEAAMSQLSGREPLSAGSGRRAFATGASALTESVRKVLRSDAKAQSKPGADPVQKYAATLQLVSGIMNARSAAPRGPFAGLLAYEMDCFAAAVRGAAAGRFFFAGGVYDVEPSMLGSVASAGGGALWLATQRPWYFLLFGGVALILASIFGTAVCRASAIYWSREESVSLGKLLAFSAEKFVDLIFAPALPLAIFGLVWLALVLCGLVGAIPLIGTLLSGLAFGVALLGGIALVFSLVALVFGLHLMWPTIAVEGSDAFDAVQRAASYVFQRAWHIAIYTFSLLIYGGFAFLAVRALALLLLKCTHTAVDVGMSVFGWSHSSAEPSLTKLQSMWAMPGWQDLPILPTVGDNNFWGRFGAADLAGTEWVASGLISFWVFVVVALVGAFVVSFFFTGSTSMYLLLRRSVDGIEMDEVFFEEFDDAALDPAPEPLPPTAPPDAASKGTALPVMGGGKP